MKILNESIQDVEYYLNNYAIDDIINEYGKDFTPYDYDVLDFIATKSVEKFDTDLDIEDVVVCKVVDKDIDIVSQAHPVIRYNGQYFDFLAQELSSSFSNLIGEDNLPVIQNIITSDNQINERLSSVKSYVMLGY